MTCIQEACFSELSLLFYMIFKDKHSCYVCRADCQTQQNKSRIRFAWGWRRRRLGWWGWWWRPTGCSSWRRWQWQLNTRTALSRFVGRSASGLFPGLTWIQRRSLNWRQNVIQPLSLTFLLLKLCDVWVIRLSTDWPNWPFCPLYWTAVNASQRRRNSSTSPCEHSMLWDIQ